MLENAHQKELKVLDAQMKSVKPVRRLPRFGRKRRNNKANPFRPICDKMCLSEAFESPRIWNDQREQWGEDDSSKDVKDVIKKMESKIP